MTRAGVLALGLTLFATVPAGAHRLDEYVQATRLAFTHDRVVVELDLTPGVSVAAPVFSEIDRDGDGRVTPPEVEAYARRVLQDVSLRVDEQACALTLTRAESPAWDEIREGEGTIRVEAVATVPLARRGRHRVHYENVHAAASGVYLVNALVPSTRDIVIRAQRRDVMQRRIDVDVEVGTPLDTAGVVLLPVAGLAVLLITRRRVRM